MFPPTKRRATTELKNHSASKKSARAISKRQRIACQVVIIRQTRKLIFVLTRSTIEKFRQKFDRKTDAKNNTTRRPICIIFILAPKVEQSMCEQ